MLDTSGNYALWIIESELPQGVKGAIRKALPGVESFYDLLPFSIPDLLKVDGIGTETILAILAAMERRGMRFLTPEERINRTLTSIDMGKLMAKHTAPIVEPIITAGVEAALIQLTREGVVLHRSVTFDDLTPQTFILRVDGKERFRWKVTFRIRKTATPPEPKE
jgi:hypothetical protein